MFSVSTEIPAGNVKVNTVCVAVALPKMFLNVAVATPVWPLVR
jgi:hypothetical protein